jgi:hypothetical protein
MNAIRTADTSPVVPSGVASVSEEVMSRALWTGCISRLFELRESEASPKKGEELTRAIEAAKADVVNTQAAMAKLLDFYLTGDPVKPVWQKKNEALSRDHHQAQATVERLRGELETQDRQHANQESLAQRIEALIVLATIQEPTLEKKRAILADVLQGGRVKAFWGPAPLLFLPSRSRGPKTQLVNKTQRRSTDGCYKT